MRFGWIRAGSLGLADSPTRKEVMHMGTTPNGDPAEEEAQQSAPTPATEEPAESGDQPVPSTEEQPAE